MRTLLRRSIPALIVLLTLATALPVTAQTPQLPDFVADAGRESEQTGSAQETVSRKDLEALAETLRDPAARERFLRRLDTLLAAQQETGGDEEEPVAKRAARSLVASARETLNDRLNAAGTALSEFAAEIGRIPAAIDRFQAGMANPAARNTWLRLAGRLAIVLLAGFAIEAVVAWLLRPQCERLRAHVRPTAGARTAMAFLRMLMRAAPVAAFGMVALSVVQLLRFGIVAEMVALLLIQAWMAARGLMIVGRFVLAPQTPELRPLPLSDAMAGHLTRWLRRLGGTAIIGFMGLEALDQLGLATSAYHVLQRLLALGLAVALIVFFTQMRTHVARWLRGPAHEPRVRSPGMRALAEVWHLVAAVFIVAVYAVWALEIPGGFRFLAEAGTLTIITLIAVRVLQIGLDRGLKRCLHIGEEMRRARPSLEPAANRFLPALRRVLGWLVNIAAVLVILHVWGAGTLDWLTSSLGREVILTVLAVVLTATAAFAVWEGIDAVIARRLARSRERDDPRQRARMETLLPLARNVIRGVVILVAAILVLPELGLNIGPLLAGAGVIGVAIGFGAQTLVKDVITGVFILAENSLAVGDWVEIGGHSGEVQALTIRTVSLRDLNGYVHVVPFNEVTSVLNMTRDHGYALADLPVGYREDVNAVTAILEDIGEELRTDAEWGPLILGPMEIFGLERMTEAGMEVRVRMKTRPLMHWAVRREILRRAKARFDAAGITLGVPHRTLAFTQDHEGKAAPARVRLEGESTGEAPEARAAQPRRSRPAAVAYPGEGES
ncbi:small conductance mechanosensitive channel [Limimonas halophila]|uniref:Small conductance mechanosensitive channel n=1 Tax=Limimonas halophila TaxID=1082479 RepID=A0A1G7R6I0_9PROT|nr:mechanosensitive ion channel domain-containing protein [Limimonas halophila]SDG06406.1 small conductance mechanosensitive channel [Limimonas halophila]